MINTLAPAKAVGHDEKKGEILEKIQRQYGAPEEKQREAVKKLGKDEFFKIMVTQIQHQDPLKPYQNEQMAAQLAQFSSLEQMLNVNQNLEKLAQAQQPLYHVGAANLIGKFVTADSSRIAHTEGKFSDITFDLPADAKKGRIMLINDKGETVREIEFADLKKGENKVQWDGKKSNNFAASSGQYLMQISAEGANGKAIPIQTSHTQMVHGIGFEGKETVLLTGDVRNPQKVLLKNVAKIIDAKDLQNGAAQGGRPGMPQGLNLGGVEIGGLENIMPGAQGVQPQGEEGNGSEAPAGFEAGLEPTGPAMIQPMGQQFGQPMGMSSEQVAAMIDMQDKNVPGLQRGLESKFMQVDPRELRKGQEKPEVAPVNIEKPVPRGSEDLSSLNLAAEAYKAGKLTPVEENANPNAALIKAGSQNANSPGNSSGKMMQSGEDGSTAGQWTE